MPAWTADRCWSFALFTQILDLRFVHIIVRHMQHSRSLAGPFAVELRGDSGLRGLVAAVVTNKADGLEAGRLEAARNTFEHLSEHRFWNTERAGKMHIAAGWVVAALRHERHHWRHQCVPEFLRNAVGSLANNVVMLAKHHMGTVLFDPSSGHDRHGVTAFDGAAHLNPRHIGHVDSIGHWRGRGVLREGYEQAPWRRGMLKQTRHPKRSLFGGSPLTIAAAALCFYS